MIYLVTPIGAKLDVNRICCNSAQPIILELWVCVIVAHGEVEDPITHCDKITAASEWQ